MYDVIYNIFIYIQIPTYEYIVFIIIIIVSEWPLAQHDGSPPLDERLN